MLFEVINIDTTTECIATFQSTANALLYRWGASGKRLALVPQSPM